MAKCLTILQISLVLVSCSLIDMSSVSGNIGVNWGTQASHRLPPKTVVRLLQENRIGKVKLFDADYGALKALGNSGIEVMVGIPNAMLQSLATSVKAAEKWVAKNVSEHVEKHNVHIRYVAVGNEPLSEAYHGSFVDSILPALHNVQLALTKAARINNVIKVTVPMSADIFKSSTGLPSGGDFRSEILGQMLGILKFLTTNAAPFLVNIHPFISLYTDPHFPLEYAFFDGNIATPLNDGGLFYHNLFDASFDTLLWALGKNGYGHDMHITIGEIGWPSDGDRNANLVYAQRFNQGFMSRVLRVQGGTPMTPGMPIDAYLFSLFDEDAKSIDPGKFERHWGLFTYDGLAKYELNLGTTKYGSLVPTRDVHYLDRKWCILKPSVRANEPNVAIGVSYACEQADCSSLGYGTSCGELDARATTSYAYNQFYQVNNQLEAACTFNKTSMITKWDPSVGDCRFEVMVDPYYGGAQRTHRCSGFWEMTMVSGLLLFLLIIM